MIVVRNLRYAYNDNETIAFPDVTVNAGSSCLLLGDSGSGKTTMLNLIGGLLRVQQGEVTIGETNLSTLRGHELDRFRGKNIGFIFQRNHLLTPLTVRQNLMMASYLANTKQNPDKVKAILEELNLSGKIDARVSELSHGQAQRVAIARALINEPAIILADEPTSALDDKNCERVAEILIGAAKRHRATLLIATHDQRLKSKIDTCVVLKSTTKQVTP